MERERLETSLPRTFLLHGRIFFTDHVLQISFQRLPKENIRKNSISLLHFYGLDSSEFCVRLLCFIYSYQVVESIYSHSLARQAYEQHLSLRSRNRWNQPGAETDDDAIPQRVSGTGASIHQHGREEAISDKGPSSGGRFHDKAWTGHVEFCSFNWVQHVLDTLHVVHKFVERSQARMPDYWL